MNHNKKMFIKKRIEQCGNLKIQKRAFKIITKHHPDKRIRETPEHILMLFHNLTETCYIELFNLVKDIKSPNQLDLDCVEPIPEPHNDNSMYHSFLKENDEFIQGLTTTETKMMYNTYTHEKMKV